MKNLLKTNKLFNHFLEDIQNQNKETWIDYWLKENDKMFWYNGNNNFKDLQIINNNQTISRFPFMNQMR